MTATHTYSVLDISASAYEEIRDLLKDAGYHHAIISKERGEVIDMHGIAVRANAGNPKLKIERPEERQQQ